MRTLIPDSRGTGLGLGRGRDLSPAPPSRGRTGPLAAEQASDVPESQRGGERQGGAQRAAPRDTRTAAPPADEQIPGQTALELRHMQPTLWSL